MQKPSTLSKIDEQLNNRIDGIKLEKANGKKVAGYFCCYIPEEIITALDIIPLRLCRFGDNQVASIGATYLTTNACPFARSCVGLKKAGTDEYINMTDIVVDAPACMQMRRVLEVWEKYFDAKVIEVLIPRRFYSNAGKDLFAAGLGYFCDELSELSGTKLDQSRLEEAVELFNNIRRLQRKLYDGLKSDTFPLSWHDVLKVIRAGFGLDREKYRALLTQLVEEIDETPPEAAPGKKVRLLLAGGMLAPGDDKLVNIINEVGGKVVMDELCTGSRGIYVDIESPDFTGISNRYLSAIPCGSLPYPRLEDDPRHAHLKKLLDDYRINGVIYYTLRFCDAYTFKVGHIKKLIKAKGVPFLHINSDHSTADVHQIRTRVEAFIESIRGMGGF